MCSFIEILKIKFVCRIIFFKFINICYGIGVTLVAISLTTIVYHHIVQSDPRGSAWPTTGSYVTTAALSSFYAPLWKG